MSHLSWQSLKGLHHQVAGLVHGLYSWWALDYWLCFGLRTLARYLSSTISRCHSHAYLRRSSPFLCLSAPPIWLRGDIMDATPFVAFLAGNTYGTENDFLDAASSGGQPAEFLSFCFATSFKQNTRPTLKMFLRHLKLRCSDKHTARWFGPAAPEACNFCRLMLLRCRPRADFFRHDEEVAPTRSVPRKLARSGLCAPRAPSLATRAQDCAAALWACMKGAIFVFWFDNFYPRWFHPTPHASNTSLICTAIAVGCVSKAIEFLWGFPSLSTLYPRGHLGAFDRIVVFGCKQATWSSRGGWVMRSRAPTPAGHLGGATMVQGGLHRGVAVCEGFPGLRVP